eukprot:COSAG02_NODE_164_length_32230_cov_37.505587_7_plen_191_part_00
MHFSGWRYEHIKAACEHADGASAIHSAISRMIAGEFGYVHATASTLPLLSAARLIALDRGGGKVRPIAIGDTWRRLACSCLIRAFKQQVEERCLAARNLAFTSDGAAIVARATELLLAANPTWIDIESDLSSAFQRASREDTSWSLASPLREQMPACSSTPMLNAAALRTLFVPLAHGPLRLPKRDAGAP